MTIGSLFAGVGGLEMGLERAGLGPVVWQVEQDAWCRSVLAKRWPDADRSVTDVCEAHGASYLDNRVKTFYDGPMANRLRKLTPDQAAECVSMYESGLSLAPIADYFNVSRQALWDLLRRRTTLRSRLRHGNENSFSRGGAIADDHAQNMVEVALRRGILTRPVMCSACGKSGTMKDGRTTIQAHHDDYNKPLSVRWLCQRCHHKWHATHTAIRKEVPSELSAVDVICGGFP